MFDILGCCFYSARNQTYYNGDWLHLQPKGYVLWTSFRFLFLICVYLNFCTINDFHNSSMLMGTHCWIYSLFNFPYDSCFFIDFEGNIIIFSLLQCYFSTVSVTECYWNIYRRQLLTLRFEILWSHKNYPVDWISIYSYKPMIFVKNFWYCLFENHWWRWVIIIYSFIFSYYIILRRFWKMSYQQWFILIIYSLIEWISC